MDTVIQQAIKRMGGQAEAARKLNVTPGMVGHWFHGRNPVAADHCPAIEDESGIRVEAIRPDVVWTRDASGRVNGYHVPLQLAS